MLTRLQRRPVPSIQIDWPHGMHPVLRRVYASRGIDDVCQIDHRLASMAAPATLGGIEVACQLLAAAIADNKRIVVVGDFDCDGATGTAVAVRGLRLLGANHVDYRVPNRQLHGYGLTTALVATLVDPAPDLIVTVDNGVASLAGVAAARARGIDVLVTDHHLPGPVLPAANAMVNPNLPGDSFPSKALAGVGVMFCLLVALRAHLRESGWFVAQARSEPDIGCLLDLVALGTVADLVALDFNNRVLVNAGMKRIRSERACAGIQALARVSGRDVRTLIPADLGFALGPRINAAGRLEDMALGIECLLADDPQHALELAERLSAINAERRELQASMIEQADAAVSCWIAAQGQAQLPIGLTLFEQDWHPGVVGLVASRLKDRLHRPVVACAPAGDGSSEVRASARSIRGIHVRDMLAEVDARKPGLILRFGGHAMAAGLTLEQSSVGEFAAEFDAVVRERAAADLFEPILMTDGELGGADLSLDLARVLRFAGPWGQGFAEPIFENDFELVSWRLVGSKHWKLKLRLCKQASVVDAMLFNAEPGATPAATFRAAYQLDVNEWNGRESLQLILRHVEALD
ncbi:MAG TPA: single-stranded-DNA-specific exonuclease RecJ [Dokdonella sp.]|uniref:single-stranded-DNA-specific exonuclease RecJ n=1 Tax=Dokdonella sp. TaxID=2291710 RepID=UPI002D8073C3|nr:single-stranded-DNA-specific exonuclease RecJ [Dokdonella sp.]HET9032764.1 single-stranded-DNA-specific exonuclease RecJ [Dokdonella sp.]